jgi:outer membrane biogenesis lipoprotein LolB
MHGRSRMRLTPPAALLAVMLLTACASTAPSATTEMERVICRELARDLPTYSARDTAATLEAGARFLDVFAAVCP